MKSNNEINEITKHAVKSMLIELLSSDKNVLKELKSQVDKAVAELELASADDVERLSNQIENINVTEAVTECIREFEIPDQDDITDLIERQIENADLCSTEDVERMLNDSLENLVVVRK